MAMGWIVQSAALKELFVNLFNLLTASIYYEYGYINLLYLYGRLFVFIYQLLLGHLMSTFEQSTQWGSILLFTTKGKPD